MAQKKTKKFNPQDEAVKNKEHIPLDALDEAAEEARKTGAPFTSPILPSPSSGGNPYMSEEDQGMEMRVQTFGPPQYGSPDPVTSAGRLLPVEQHPLNAAALPEGHPAAISEDYGKGAVSTITAGRPDRTDLERDSNGERDLREAEEADSYDELTVADLKELARAREIDGYSAMNKEELVSAHEQWDEDNPEGS